MPSFRTRAWNSLRRWRRRCSGNLTGNVGTSYWYHRTSPMVVPLDLYFRCGLRQHGVSGAWASGKVRKRLTQRREAESIPALFLGIHAENR